ncbi:hypothetical protein [Streptomyces chartreusis]|uniref:hypothetical protein n=1 Tax=Streptomyces chartreusis TaxID=1969 RepID=UPI00363104D9
MFEAQCVSLIQDLADILPQTVEPMVQPVKATAQVRHRSNGRACRLLLNLNE